MLFCLLYERTVSAITITKIIIIIVMIITIIFAIHGKRGRAVFESHGFFYV